jgi:TPR repeat protein
MKHLLLFQLGLPIVALSVLTPGQEKPPSPDTLTTAKEYYAENHYRQALPLFRRSAKAGSPEAAFFLGAIYETGGRACGKMKRRQRPGIAKRLRAGILAA